MIDNVQNALRELGATSDEIADSLRLLGITGYKKCSTKCVIANYLEAVTGQTWVVSGSAHMASDTAVVVFLTFQVKNFIGKFDEGFYPDLIATRPTPTVKELVSAWSVTSAASNLHPSSPSP